jgi:outer membrane protein insertion porin family
MYNFLVKRFPPLALLFLGLILFHSPSLAADQKKLVIEDIKVEGNRYFSSGKIKDQMSLKENRWYNFFKKRRYNPKKAELDQFSIDSLYHVTGFLAVKCEIGEEKKGEQICVVRVTINEGLQTRLGTISMKPGLPELADKSIKMMKPLQKGDPFNWTKIYEATFNVKSIYANNGYPYADVQVQLSGGEEDSIRDVTFQVIPDKKVFFGKVAFEGLKLTKEHVLRRELTMKEGDLYSRDKILDSQQRLYSTGLFSYINLKAKDVEQKPDKPEFVLKVIEKKPNYVSFKGELAQNSPQVVTQQEYLTTDFTGEWGNRNLAGTSRKIGVTAFSSYMLVPKIQRLSNRFTITYIEPWFLGSRTLLDMDVYYEPGVKNPIQMYRIESYGANINLSREYSKHTKVWLTHNYEQVKIYNIPPDELETYKRELGINVRRKIILSGEKDTRSNIFVPLSGSYSQVYTEYVGGLLGGDNNFSKSTFSWSRYNLLGRKRILNVLATRIEVGYAQELTHKDYVPTFDRFYMGGASTMRGFKENSMGPVDETGTPIGGRVMILGNVEYRRELFWKLGYTIFVDAGNLWDKVKDIKFDNFKLSSGLGLQFFTPVGPLRLDYGRQLPVKKSPKSGRFHLSILYVF